MRRVLVPIALAGAVLACAWLALRWRVDARPSLVPPAAAADRPRPRATLQGIAAPAADEPALAAGGERGSRIDAAPEGEAPVRARVAPARARLEALCVDERGAPLAGVEGSIANAEGVPSAWSGADGRVVVELELPFEPSVRPGLPPDSVDPSTLAVTFRAPVRGARTLRVPAAEGTTSLGRVVLPPGGALVGRVVDHLGRPVVGALVRAALPVPGAVSGAAALADRPDGAPGGDVAVTDAAGRYGLEGLFAGEVALTALAPGAPPVSLQPVRVEAGETSVAPDLVLAELELATAIRGVARGPDGAPVEGAWIGAKAQGLVSRAGLVGRSGPDGGFTIATAEGNYRLTARAPRVDWVAEDLEAVPAGAVCEVAFRAAPAIEVTAATPDGYACEDWRLMVSAAARVEARGVGRWHVLAPAQPFELSLALPGMVTFEAGPFSPADLPASHHFVVRPPFELVGRVVAHGRPVSGARVHVHREAPGYDRRGEEPPERLVSEVEGGTSTRPDGTFAIPVATVEGRFLHVHHPGFARAEAGPFQAPGSRFEVELRPGGRIAGELLLPGGMSPGGMTVLARSGDGHVEATLVGQDGRFAFEHLAPGTWRLQRADGSRPGPVRAPALGPLLEVREGETAVASIDLRQVGLARLFVSVAIGGQPLSHWRWEVVGGADPRTGTADAAGSFETLAGSGRRYVQLQSPSSGAERHALYLRLDVSANLNQEDVRLDAGALLVEGLEFPATVDDELLANGELPLLQATVEGPVATYHVFVHGPAPRPLRVERVPTGEWQLTWMPGGWKAKERYVVRSATVAPEETARVSFEP